MPVVATKNGKVKTFSDYAWKLLGSDKNGWEPKVEPTGQVVTNEVVKSPKTVNQPEQVVTNELNSASEPTVTNEVPNEVGDKDAFITIASENLKRNQIKDYLDTKEVSYKQNISTEAIIELLGQTMNYNVEELKTVFSL